jgi:2-polyprenyl-6-methoxyphenol hydroxylase-like FAD-dependent oxidoreductase
MTYDAIIVGARCAGSATAIHLARRGYRVLVVDRATFPSDTISTHLVHPVGVAALARLGLLERLAASGCPPIRTYGYNFGPVTITGAPGTADSPVAYSPRRTILDKLLVDAAIEAGAEVREGFKVEEILAGEGRAIGIRGRLKDGERSIVEHAPIVIGADGRHSLIAATVRPEQYDEKPPLLALYYTYWSGLPCGDHFQTYIRGNRGLGLMPTHDGLTLTICGWPAAEFETNRKDLERHVRDVFALVPDVASRASEATREAPIAGALVANYLRKPYGPGWVLVGDAGYNRDAITAQGITDALLSAERCAAALHEVFSGKQSFEEALRGYHEDRDRRVRPMYEFTSQVATLESSPESMAVLAAIQHHQPCMNAFAQMNAGTIAPAAFEKMLIAAFPPS